MSVLYPERDSKVSVETLKRYYTYDPDTGHFTAKTSAGNYKAGRVAGTLKADSGYILISIEGTQYRAQRLAYLYMTGEWPDDVIDHVNDIKQDNRWLNLRKVTQKVNAAVGPNSNGKANTFGVPGVLWNKDKTLIGARIRVDGRYKTLGTFVYLSEAYEAYRKAKRYYHGVDTPAFEEFKVPNIKGTGQPYWRAKTVYEGESAVLVKKVILESQNV